MESEIVVPLKNKIESKLGQMVVVYKRKEDMCFLYRTLAFSDTNIGIIVAYDLYAKIFSFQGKKYTEKQFEKVLDLLAFT